MHKKLSSVVIFALCQWVLCLGAPPEYSVTTIAGSPTRTGSRDGIGPEAEFGLAGGNFRPLILSVDAAGNIYVPDWWNNTIRRVSPFGEVVTVAGNPWRSWGAEDGIGTVEARFYWPMGTCVDAAGSIYVADSRNSIIRRVASDGVVTTIAGKAQVFGSADGPAASAQFSEPQGLAIARDGTIYVADTGNSIIRKISPAGAVTTVAGSPYFYNQQRVDGVGAAAKFWHPVALCLDEAGNVYVADSGNFCVRKVTPEGAVSTLAGGARGFTDGVGEEAQFGSVTGIALNPSGGLWVTDSGNRAIRSVGFDGTVGTVLRSPGNEVTIQDGVGSNARLGYVSGICVSPEGNLLFTDTDLHRYVIREASLAAPSAPRFVAHPADLLIGEGGDAVFKASVQGGLLTVNYQWQMSADGGSTWNPVTDGAGFSGALTSSLTVATVVASQSGLCFRCLARSEAGEGAPSSAATLSVYVQPLAYDFSTLDVFTGSNSYADGPSGLARFAEISGVAIDSTGVIYLSDSGSNTIRQVSHDGTVVTFAGMAWGAGSLDATGGAARFGTASGFGNIGPRGVALGGSGILYVADTGNHTIRAITAGGVVTTLVGAARQNGTSDGKGYYARFNTPSGIAIDRSGNLLIADTGNHTIRRVTPDGVSSTVAGLGGTAGYADGSAANARFSSPRGIAMGEDGNIYVADTGNFVIRRIDGVGNVTTLAGSSGTSGWRDGAGADALFGTVTCVISQPGRGLCVVDSSNHVLRTVSFAGEVRTWAGYGQVAGCADGPLYVARFKLPLALAFTGEGEAVVADSGNRTVRKIGRKGSVETIAGNAGWIYGGICNPTGVAADADGNVYVACPDNGGYAPDLVKMAPGKQVSFLSEHSGAELEDLPERAQCVAVDRYGVVYASASHGLWRFPKSGERLNVTFSGSRSIGIAVDSGTNAYVLEYSSHRIDRFGRDDVDGRGEFFAGGVPGANDGKGNAASFNYPQGVATGPDDMIYVADTYNNTIRKVTPDRVVSTIAGVAGRAGSLDGGRSAALFKGPVGIAVDRSGVVYVSDTGNHLIRRLTRDGSVTTIGGAVGQTGRVDGAGGLARFSSPKGIAAVGAGVVFIADSSNNVVRRGDPRLMPYFSQHPTAVTTPPTGPVQFSAAACGTGELGYRWQVSYDDGSSWSGLADGGDFRGTTTATMTVATPTTSVSGVVFRCIALGTLGEGISAKARLVVLAGLSEWRLQQFGTTANAGAAANDADPDLDGRCNFLEYALGSGPTTADSDRPPLVDAVTDGAGTHLTLTFNRIADPALTYTVEASSELVDWSPVWTSTGAGNVAGDTVVIDSPASQHIHPRRFLRLKVSY